MISCQSEEGIVLRQAKELRTVGSERQILGITAIQPLAFFNQLIQRLFYSDYRWCIPSICKCLLSFIQNQHGLSISILFPNLTARSYPFIFQGVTKTNLRLGKEEEGQRESYKERAALGSFFSRRSRSCSEIEAARAVININIMNKYIRRILKDYDQIQNQKDEGYIAVPSKENVLNWKGVIFGQQDTPWEGGTFQFTMVLPQNYPNQPPSLRFKTPIFHPNFYVDGKICLDRLQKKWTPSYTISSLLKTVRLLFVQPNTDSPANVTAAQVLNSNLAQYERRVRQSVEQSWRYIQ